MLNQADRPPDTLEPLPTIDGLTEVYPLGHPVVIVVLAEGIFAIDGRCPHRGGPMAEGQLEGCALRCPWHGFKYDVRDGHPVWPAGWDDAPVYAVRVRDGVVEVMVAGPA